MVAVSRALLGRSAGVIGSLAVLFLWVGLALPAHLMPRFGLVVGLVIMSAGVLFTAAATFLHSKWWLIMLAAAIATFVMFLIAAGQ
jgi:hypothetical protein